MAAAAWVANTAPTPHRSGRTGRAASNTGEGAHRVVLGEQPDRRDARHARLLMRPTRDLRLRQVSGDEHLVLHDGVHARTVAALGSTRRLNRRPFEKRLEQRR
jgi:hypothetical protein